MHRNTLRKNVLPNFPQNIYGDTDTYSKEICDEIIWRVESWNGNNL